MREIRSKDEMDARSSTKRRRLRKGTTSCWECKRRKIKCEYNDADSANTRCRPCDQRDLHCVSQELPEPALSTYLTNVGNHGSTQSQSGHSTTTPASTQLRHAARTARVVEASAQEPHEDLSRRLYKALPSQADVQTLCSASKNPSLLAHEINIIPYAVLYDKGVVTRETLLKLPSPDTNPVLIAKHMLLLASYIQHLHPSFLNEISGMAEPPRTIMERLLSHVGALITTNDQLLGSIEGLECVMEEGLYQMNMGNLRRGWITVRRALSIAQLMGLNRHTSRHQYKVLDQETRFDAQHMWFRLVFLDRYICLMLGLPAGCTDRNIASEANLIRETPMGRLERIQCDIAGRLIERNEDPSCTDHMETTYSLDMELQKASKHLPSKWWLIPNLESSPDEPEKIFWNTRQLFAQLLHYNLLNQLHLPYMLSSMQSGNKFEYSRMTCINSSREILSRYVALRSNNSAACSCRTVDFGALMAAMTLLLAHLHGQRMAANLLAHQYQSDRAMIERVQESMVDLNRFNSDGLSAQSADLLGKLLAIDSTTAGDGAEQVTVHLEGDVSVPVDNSAVSVHVPYFGIVRITRDGMSKTNPSSANTTAERPTTKFSFDQRRESLNEASSPDGVQDAARNTFSSLSAANVWHNQQKHTSTAQSSAQLATSEPLSPIPPLPSLVAGIDDWAFQGVDQAFFESLMRIGDIEWDDFAS